MPQVCAEELEYLIAHTRITAAVWVALIGIGFLNAETPRAHPPAHPPETGEIDAPNDIYIGRALTGTIGSNLLIWGWDRYVLGASWADVTLDTMKGNIEEGLVWDNSVFVTNQILHPYQGALYFNSARSSGFSFWQSVPFVVGGSLMWEFLAERNNPSINDFITTSFGGIAFGEMSHRITSLLLDDPTSSSVGPGRRLLAAVFDPVGSLNRTLYGPPPPVLIDARQPPYTLSFMLGAGAAFSEDDGLPPVNPIVSTGLSFRYGDPYRQKSDYKPYDYFDVNVGLDIGLSAASWDLAGRPFERIYPGPASLDLFTHAVLFGKKIYPGTNAKGVIGLFQYFDYLESDTYKFSQNGAGPGLQVSIPFSDGKNLELQIHVPGIALGVINSEHSLREARKDYSMGPGVALKTGLVFTSGGRLGFSVNHSNYWIETYSGADRNNVVGILNTTFDVALTESISLGLGAGVYDRWSDAKTDKERVYVTQVYVTRR